MHQRRTEVVLDASAPLLVDDPELECGRQSLGDLVVGKQSGCRFRGAEVVVDRALDAVDSTRKGEVVCKFRQDEIDVRAVEVLERLADLEMKLRRVAHSSAGRRARDARARR